MAKNESSIDGDINEARRTAGLVLMAILDHDNRAAADLIKSFDNPQDAWIITASLAAALLADHEDPLGFIRAFISEDIDALIAARQSDTARAKSFLREQLADGKPHPYRPIRLLWRTQNLGRKDPKKIDKDLSNAARLLGVVSGNVNSEHHYYQLPKSRAARK